MPAKASKPAKSPQCVKCDSAMEPGMIIDRGPYGVSLNPQWRKGGGIEFSWKSGLKTSAGPVRTVVTWRCSGCGFLESYAR